MSPIECLTVDELNDLFVEQEPRINEQIDVYTSKNIPFWAGMIERAAFEYGNGYEQRKMVFHSHPAPQIDRGTLWRPMAASTPAEGETEEFNACNPAPAAVVKYGFEQKTYRPYEVNIEGEPICLTDMVFKWNYTEQMRMVYESWAELAPGVLENWNRDTYASFATIFPAVNGFMSAGGVPGEVPNPIGKNVGRLTQEYLDILYSLLARGARRWAIGGADGAPVFGLITSAETSQEVIMSDPNRRGDMQALAQAGVGLAKDLMLDGYGVATAYRRFVHMHDPFIQRFVEDGAGGIVRVYPWLESATTTGTKFDLNPDYLNAPYELSLIWVKNVFINRVLPPMRLNAGGGMNWPDANKYWGEFMWQNILDRECNPNGEIGNYKMRQRIAPEPGTINHVYGILHTRCVPQVYSRCLSVSGCTDDAVESGSVESCSDGDEDGQIVVELDGCLDAEIGDSVTVTFADGTQVGATIVAGANAPAYILDLGDLPEGEDSWCAAYEGIASVAVGAYAGDGVGEV